MKRFLLFAIPFTLFFSIIPSAFAKNVCRLPNSLGRIVNPHGAPLYSVKVGTDTYTYWEISYLRERLATVFYTVVKQDAIGRCFVAFTDPSGDADTMTKGVPKAVAITFSEESLKDAINHRGREAIQRDLDKFSSEDIIYPEQRDAYLKMGFKIPSSAHVSNYWSGLLKQSQY
jgi:hypothetical protein